MAKVSVIVPVYNSEGYLGESLESLERQDFPDAEFVLVNDGSTDRSLEICKEFVGRDPRFVVIDQKNAGPANARNNGIRRSTGEYICFMDSDDRMLPGALSLLYSRASVGNYDIVIHGASVFGADEVPQWVIQPTSVTDAEFQDFRLRDIFEVNGCTPFLWQHFVRSSIIKGNGLEIDEKLEIGEDQAFEILYFSKAKKVLSISDKLYDYRIGHAGSIMNKYSKRLKDKLWQHIEMIRYVQDNLGDTVEESDQARIASWAIEMTYWDLIKLLYYDQVPFATELTKLLSKWNPEAHRSEFSVFDRMRYEHVAIMAEYVSDPQVILDGFADVKKRLEDELDREKKTIVYRAGKKILSMKRP